MAPKTPSVPRPAYAGPGKAPRKLQVPAPEAAPAQTQVAPVKGAAVDVEADTAHAVPPDFNRALDAMMAKRAPVAPPPAPPSAPAPMVIPPAPPSTPPERMPARAAMISGASFAPVSRSSIAPVVTSITPPSPVYEPAVVSATLRAPVTPMPPAPASAPPPPSSVPVAYERAFRRWSQPSFDMIPEDVPSTEPLTFQVYTPDALPPPSRPRFASELAFAPPREMTAKKGNLLVRAGAVVLGVAVMVAVGVAGLAAASDDAPKAAAAAAAQPIATVLPPPVETALPMPIAAVPAPTVVVVPDPAPAVTVTVKPAKPAAKKKVVADKDKGNLPPNPYGG